MRRSDGTNKQGLRDLSAGKPTRTEAPPPPVAPADAPAARDDIMEYFEYGHLPEGPMRATSALFASLASIVHDTLPRCAERSVALRKLLEGKDAAVRAARARR